MKSCGIIAEYNPFHNGHRYQIVEAKKITGADCLVVVMSGNFLQRGEPAIIDKWKRTELALAAGADLVIELPFAHAVQAADYFAAGGVELLQALGVDYLSFGTDYEGELDYHQFAEFQLENQVQIDEAFRRIQNNGMNYPQQMTEVYRQLFPEMRLDFSSPNHILGMSYAKENIKYPRPMQLAPIKRHQAQHNEQSVNHEVFASGTAIRQAMLAGRFAEVQPVVPLKTYQALTECPLISWEKLWPYLKYQLTILSTSDLAEIYQMTQGIEYRLKEVAKQAESFHQFVELVKTKRFTWTRIQRLSTYLLLNIKDQDILRARAQNYLRVLGFSQTGQQFLKHIKKQTTLPIITNINKKNEELLILDIKAGKIYQMATAEKNEQDYYKRPITIKC
ncbi:nucleotidyltransferase [Vagococcus zengguangii]|uniref:tRNA(Met) cytidine acetate ligase n=1 Tax=Vagococcus zengguangii TaxID=2571750 RepID=A0A4D7CW02_9ENTE|nr:nucleotidyltransferase [Vagococcus zengguangii]QCI86370.1 nucleotidyltransferase [Vagococcus zengguangii]TLG81380.1 nucleotidyltransferase [Vagococcus zengguangii]